MAWVNRYLCQAAAWRRVAQSYTHAGKESKADEALRIARCYERLAAEAEGS